MVLVKTVAVVEVANRRKEILDDEEGTYDLLRLVRPFNAVTQSLTPTAAAPSAGRKVRLDAIRLIPASHFTRRTFDVPALAPT